MQPPQDGADGTSTTTAADPGQGTRLRRAERYEAGHQSLQDRRNRRW
jgi:hypothetical protein